MYVPQLFWFVRLDITYVLSTHSFQIAKFQKWPLWYDWNLSQWKSSLSNRIFLCYDDGLNFISVKFSETPLLKSSQMTPV